jgi:hypothetical protein
VPVSKLSSLFLLPAVLCHGLISWVSVILQVTANSSVFHLNYTLGVMRDKIFMCYYNNGLAFPMKLVEEFEYALACFAVEITRRLVSQQDAGITNKCPGNSHTLLFTS